MSVHVNLIIKNVLEYPYRRALPIFRRETFKNMRCLLISLPQWVQTIDSYILSSSSQPYHQNENRQAGLLCLGLYSISTSSGRLLLLSSLFHPVAFALHLASSAVSPTFLRPMTTLGQTYNAVNIVGINEVDINCSQLRAMSTFPIV